MFSFAGLQERQHNSKFEKVYAFRGILPDAEGDMDRLFLDAIEVIFTSLDLDADIPESAFLGQSFQKKTRDAAIECIGMKYRHLWAARSSFFLNEEPNIRRKMIYEIAVTKTKRGLELGLQVIAEYILAHPVDFQPDLIFKISDRIGLYQSRGPILDGTPIVLHDESQTAELFDLVADPDRTLPVIVITEINLHSWNPANNQPKFLLSTHDLAKHLRGYAFVVEMPYDAGHEWSELVGRPFSVYDGAVRTFYPSSDFLNSSCKDHPLIIKEHLPMFQYKNQKGARAYFASLVGSIRKYSATAKIPWHNLYFLTDATRLKTEIDLFAATLPKAATPTDPLAVMKLQEDFDSAQTKLRQKESLIAELEAQQKKSEAAATELRARIEHLTFMLSGPAGKMPTEGPPQDDTPAITYENMPGLCRTEFAGKLILLKRAEHSLNKAQFESPALVFQALALLANEYRDLRMEKIGQAEFAEKCRALGLAIADVRKDRPLHSNSIFAVNYPPDTQEVQALRYQLCKGNSKKRRYRMRIYFFWSDCDKLVVVGDLPQQL